MGSKPTPTWRLNKKSVLVFTAILLLGASLVIIGTASHKNKSEINTKLAQTYTQHLQAGSLIIDSQYQLAPDGDKDKNGIINGGDTVRFTFALTNKNNQAARYNTFKTGIPANSIAYVHNEQGITGINYQDPIIAFTNVVVLPGQTQNFSFDALMLVANKDQTFVFTPSLIDTSGKEIVRGESKSLTVGKADFSQVTVTNKERQQ